MRRRLLITMVLATACIGTTCRESRDDARPKVETRQAQPSNAEPTPAERRAIALDAANEHIEAARILSLPLDPLPETRLQGIALPTYSELPDLSYEQMLTRIRDVGATHVSIVLSWDQQTIFHNRIERTEGESPSDAEVGEIVAAADRLGLRTMLFPIIHIERRNTGEWRGKMAPTDLDRWREDYRSFILHHARLAQAHRVEILCVGSELSSQESATDFWRTLIKDVRAVYDGELIYSANWDHYQTPEFWDDLDYLGVSSYFEVAQRSDEPIFKVTQRWLTHREELLAFARKTGKPLVLTEVGYPSIDSAAVKPWDYTARTAPNPNAQLAAFRSLSEAWGPVASDSAAFAGLFIWHGWGHGGADDVSYPIWGKSTEALVKDWYGAPKK